MRYCWTAYGKRIHIWHEWRGEDVTWCGEYVETWVPEEEIVKESLCKHCLKKWQESQAAQEAKPLEKGQ